MKNYQLKDKLVAVNRVTKVTKGGRTFSFAALVVVGDGNGHVGYGLGKGKEVAVAVAKAIESAKKSIIEVQILKETIPHIQQGRYRASKILLRPASHGTGLIAGGAMRAVLEMAGVNDVLGKSFGSANPHNVVKATFDALAKLKTPQFIAKERGISLKQLFESTTEA